MKKINVETMACFKQVAYVIGKEKAKIELFKVVENFKVCHVFTKNTLIGDELVYCFDWTGSPQGWGFWNDIDDGIDPYGN